MKKQSIRAFGFGLLAATAALFFSDQLTSEQPAELSNEQMIQQLQDANYVVQKEENEQAPIQQSETIQTKNNSQQPTAASVTVSIETGMSSNEIAARLKKNGIIEDSSSFNQFLIKNGYADKLQIGSFVFKGGMTEKEVADILTK